MKGIGRVECNGFNMKQSERGGKKKVVLVTKSVGRVVENCENLELGSCG